MFNLNFEDKDFYGADWVKVDLHLHTPATEKFILPDAQNLDDKDSCERLADQYIRQLEKAEIRIGAITDYNQIDPKWFKLLQIKASKKNIHLFPGVELSLNLTGKYGLHLLLIFEQNIDINGLNTFLHSLDKNPQNLLINKRKHRNIDCKDELENCIQEVCKRFNQCLLIIPHPEDDKGFCQTYNTSQQVKYINALKPDAFEYLSEEAKEKLISAGLKRDQLNNLAIVENSDPKCLEEIGTKKRKGRQRTTYIKLSSFSIDALKMALHDPQVRVRIYEKPEIYYDHISRININGVTFLKNINIIFNPELNTFIGGRGVGKSAIIESIRYGLDLPVYADRSSHLDFVENVVGSGGEIILQINRFYGREKKTLYVKRVVGKENVISDESGIDTGLTIRSLFEEAKYPVIIGQKELYYLSTTPTFRLQLLDEIIGAQLDIIQKDFRDLIEQIEVNSKNILRIEEYIKKKEEYEQKVKELDGRIGIYKQLGVEEKLKRWTDLIDDEEKLIQALKKIKEIRERFESLFSDLDSELNYLQHNLTTGKSENKPLLVKAADVIAQFKEDMENIRMSVVKNNQSLITKVEQLRQDWLNKKCTIEAEITRIKNELTSKGLKPEQLESLTKEKARLIPLLENIKRHEANLIRLQRQRAELKELLGKKREEIFNVRKDQLTKINEKLKDRIRIEVQFKADYTSFKEKLTTLLKGSKVTNEAIEALTNTRNKVIDGLSLSKYIEEGKDLTKEFNLTKAMEMRIKEWFKDLSKLHRLETFFPEDRVVISLKVNDEYRELDKLSVGQKATALLLLLFAQENRILILDQPEEDLDNRFVYDDVVKILRDLKGNRQLIVATHNANIPVLGDAEQIIVLEVENNNCKISQKGSIDINEIKTEVKNIMEGGEDAFRIRAEKYGGV